MLAGQGGRLARRLPAGDLVRALQSETDGPRQTHLIRSVTRSVTRCVTRCVTRSQIRPRPSLASALGAVP